MVFYKYSVMFLNLQHQYSKYANQTLDWLPMDTKQLYQENLKKYPDRMTPWINCPITYNFNSHGFRSDEFCNKPNAVFLGCSHTCGIGLPIEQTWAHIVSQELGIKNFNLGIGATSNDTAFRLAQHWIPQLKPQLVVFLPPEKNRAELHTVNNIEDFGPWASHPWWKSWVSNETNSEMNSLKNLWAIQYLCNQHNIKFIQADIKSCLVEKDYARDLAHNGPKTNQALADLILSHI